MLKEEILRILRNPKWKYLFFVILASFLYYVVMYNDATHSLSPIFLTLTSHEQLLIGIATIPSFLYAFLLYSIALEEEPVQTWYTTLAFPMRQQLHILSKAIAILLFLIPGCLLSLIAAMWLNHTVSYTFLTFMFSIQSIYFINFFFYCFYVSQGYISSMGTITSVNILQRLTPIALFVCIINAGNWIQGFSLLWWKMVILILILFVGLLVCSNYTMHSKLYREIVLTKLFQTKPQTMSELTAEKYKNRVDVLLQFLFKKLERKKSSTYWKTCAVVEVTLKQNFFSIFFSFVFLYITILCKSIIPAIIMLYFIGSIVYHYKKEKKHIQIVYII